MFVEPHIGKGTLRRGGWIEVVCGSMFSGKTEELIRRLNRALLAHQHVEIFKPAIDKRYDKVKIVSHKDSSITSTPVNFANDILLRAGNCEVVGIDEAQFFDDEIVRVCNELANRGIRVIVAGLDMAPVRAAGTGFPRSRAPPAPHRPRDVPGRGPDRL